MGVFCDMRALHRTVIPAKAEGRFIKGAGRVYNCARCQYFPQARCGWQAIFPTGALRFNEIKSTRDI